MVGANCLYDSRLSSNWLDFLLDIHKKSKDWVPLRKNSAALKRQAETVQLLIQAYKAGQPGVILADDVGLGKTWIGILSAIAWASAGLKVLVVTPNERLRLKWYDEFYKWYGNEDPNPALWDMNNGSWKRLHPGLEIDWALYAQEADRIRAGKVLLVTSKQFMNNKNAWNCDLLIVDEAHRGKSKHGFLDQLTNRARSDFRLLLTATPFGKDIETLSKLLNAASGNSLDITTINYLKCTWSMLHEKTPLDPEEFEEMINRLRIWFIRHTLENLPLAERRQLGEVRHVFGNLPAPNEVDQSIAEEIIETPVPIKEPSWKKIILHSERLRELHHDFARGVETLVAPYSPGGITRIARKLLDDNSEEANPAALYHAKAIIDITEKNSKLGPMEEHLLEFARTCLKQGEKFIIFCYHHQVANSLVDLLREASLEDEELGISCLEKDEIKRVIESLEKSSRAQNQSTGDQVGKDYSRLDRLLSPGYFRYLNRHLDIPGQGEDLKQALHRILSALSGRKEKFEGKPLEIVETLVGVDTRRESNIRLFFNSPFYPMALVATTAHSEGIDLHTNCRIVIHYELGYRPETLLQANGRVRRVGSFAGRIRKPVIYYYPYLEGTRSEALTREVVKRVGRFGHFMGGVPEVTPEKLRKDAARSQKGIPEPEMPEIDFTNGGFCKALHLPRT